MLVTDHDDVGQVLRDLKSERAELALAAQLRPLKTPGNRRFTPPKYNQITVTKRRTHEPANSWYGAQMRISSSS